MSSDSVLLVPTCLVETFLPEVQEAARAVLQHLKVVMEEDPNLTCCGQPLYNAGLQEEARQAARGFLKRLAHHDGPIVFLAGSCASMVRVEYPRLFAGTSEEAQAREVALRTYEFSQFLTDRLERPIHGVFPHRVAYHPSCHLRRVLGVDTQPRKLLDALEGLERLPWPEEDVCCGFGGVFSGLLPSLAEAMGQDKIRRLRATGAQAGVTCDPGCLLHLQGLLGEEGPPMLHIAEVLARALNEAQDTRRPQAPRT